MITLPEEYIISKFFQHVHQPKFNRYNGTYQGGCCICNEGGSLGKKRRFYYIPKKDNMFCHNCGWSSKPIKWILQVTGKTFVELIEDVKLYDYSLVSITEPDKPVKVVESATLPTDSINIFDEQQLKYHQDNDIVKQCLKLVKDRKLDTAVNRPKSLYLSLTDKVHKNRLVIPFFNESKKIEFYQTRGFLDRDLKTRPKYISKINAEKTLFNIDQVDSSHDTVYVFEGPINAFFTRNSVAVAGITDKSSSSFTPRQQHQVDTTLKWHNKIWVLDSQWLDNTSLKKTELLLKDDHTVFIWPEKYGTKYKDFNDICMAYNIDEIKPNFIQKNSFKGIEGILRLASIKRFRSDLVGQP